MFSLNRTSRVTGPMSDLYGKAADSVHELLREARSTLATAEPGSPMHDGAAVSANELSELEGMLRRAASGTQFAQVHPGAIKALSDAWELCSAY